MFKDLVQELLQDALDKRDDLYLLNSEILPNNAIRIVIDGDKGVLVEDCVFISRAIEHNLDREEYDFSIEVTSPGAASPIVNKRQYHKNLGRTLEVKQTNGETIEAKLTEATEQHIRLEWKTREPKPVGKGKVTVKKQADIAYDDIDSAKVIIKF